MDSLEISSTFINKIPQFIPTRHFIFQSNWGSDEINLKILDSNESKEWDCIIAHSDIKDSASELEIPYEQFFEECKRALTTNGGIEHFQYSLEDNKFILTKEDEFKMQYLQVIAKPTYGLQQTINISAVDLMESLRTELIAEKERSRHLNAKYQDVLNELQKCIQEMNSMERNLLRKFAVLLNSKKDKIAELQDLLIEKNKKLESAGICSTRPAKRKSCDEMDESVNAGIDGDFMEATQVMTQPVISLPKRKKFNPTEEVETRQSTATEKRDEAALLSSGLEEQSTHSQNMDLNESPDIFDLM